MADPNNAIEKELLKRATQGMNKVKSLIPPPAIIPQGSAENIAMSSPILQMLSLLQRGGAAVQNALPPAVRARLESLIQSLGR